MDHPDYSYKKELFNIYLERIGTLMERRVRSLLMGVDLSYYTTSTKGD
jgi:hypothetical protein